MKRPTIADIARRAGVTKAAVSFALNGQPGVSAATRERILAIADEIGFQPSRRPGPCPTAGPERSASSSTGPPARSASSPTSCSSSRGSSRAVGRARGPAAHPGRGPGRGDRDVPVVVGPAPGRRGVRGRPGSTTGGWRCWRSCGCRPWYRHPRGAGSLPRSGRTRGRDPGRGRVPGRGRAPRIARVTGTPGSGTRRSARRRSGPPRWSSGVQAVLWRAATPARTGPRPRCACWRAASRPPRSCTTTTSWRCPG